MNQIRIRTRKLLQGNVAPLWQRLHDKRANKLIEEFLQHLKGAPLSDYLIDNDAYFRGVFVDFLRGQVTAALNRIERLQTDKQHFDSRLGRVSSQRERDALLLDYARELGASTKQIRADRRALRRWFGEDALRDRWLGHVAAAEQRMDFALDRLGEIVGRALLDEPDNREQTWLVLRFDDLLEPLFAAACDPRVQVTGLKALTRCVDSLPRDQAANVVNGAGQQLIYRLALDPDAPVWLQRSALQLIGLVAPETLLNTLRYRFAEPAEGDDLFVRSGAVQVWRDSLPTNPELADLHRQIVLDPAPLVRQQLAFALADVADVLADATVILFEQLLEDGDSAVRGATLLALPELCASAKCDRMRLMSCLEARLQREQDEFVCRVAFEVTVQIAPHIRDSPAAVDRLLRLLGERHRLDDSLRIRRWSAMARERFLCASQTDWQQAAMIVQRQLADNARDIDLSELPPSVSETVLMRILAVLAQQDHGMDVAFTGRQRARVRSGDRFGFRWWRWLYEWRHPSTDKRQGFRHTVGRHFSGSNRAPSAILAEVSQTKVPGEPLTIAEEDGWRPYLPLVDECLAALDQERKLEVHKIFTSEGVTEIVPPSTLRRQLSAWWRLTRRFTEFAQWRNWREGDSAAPSTYISQLEELGFTVRFQPYSDPVTGETCQDSSISRFFPAMAPLPLLDDLIGDFKMQALSAYENTVFELAAFVGLIGGFFFGRHLLLATLLRRARRRLPLVIGGWGTRGKSGTERLKAAMFNALGLSVFSKTTGCEAMFVMNRPYREPKELFLFRPYDKATIWEQYNMVRLASSLDSDVFLWECMGLTPAFIRVLQRDWMRDDIATITNTSPDHEDLQGPAGVNIPQVMCEFIPVNSRLVTSEEKMLPILERDALTKNTHLRSVGWLQAGLLTPDVLERFPYEEHPHNIALVLGLGEELGIERDLALKEMADRVIMDLGVLKTYPEARIAGRRLEFIMGMSANERFGAMNNWQRMGLAESNLTDQPEIWISTLVNNRADRVARSRVFADLLVQDVRADQHVLIGTNLKGLSGYIDQSLDHWLEDLPDGTGSQEVGLLQSMLTEKAAALRVPITQAELEGRLTALLDAAAPFSAATVDDMVKRFKTDAGGDGPILEWGVRFIAQFQEFQALHSAIAELDCDHRSVAAVAELRGRIRATLAEWFQQKLVVVEDPHISGDDLIALVAAQSPPTMLTRMMGMQNIKGTGLSFVYCWQEWEQQWLLACQLRGEEESAITPALERLVGQSEVGVLGREFLADTLERLRHHPAAQRESAQAQIAALLQRTGDHEVAMRESDKFATRRKAVWLDKLVAGLEALFDAGDAVRRRRLADQVYRDLVSQQISEDRAILEIKQINARQKGGWLRRKLGW